MKLPKTPIVVVVIVSLTVLFADVPAVFADHSFCAGSFSFSTFKNIVVPAGSTCKLDRFNVVNGNIDVKSGGSLIICPDNKVNGNIKAEESDTVFISDLLFVSPCLPPGPPKALGITIGGNVDIKGAGSFTLLGNPSGVTSIGGNVMVKQTQDVRMENFDGIHGNVEAKDNVNVAITGNTIDGNLKIRGTTASCTGDATNNSVGGNVDPCP